MVAHNCNLGVHRSFWGSSSTPSELRSPVSAGSLDFISVIHSEALQASLRGLKHSCSETSGFIIACETRIKCVPMARQSPKDFNHNNCCNLGVHRSFWGSSSIPSELRSPVSAGSLDFISVIHSETLQASLRGLKHSCSETSGFIIASETRMKCVPMARQSPKDFNHNNCCNLGVHRSF